MSVTHEEVGDIISEIFLTDPLIDDNFVGFGLMDENYKAEVIIRLFTPESLNDSEPVRQAMQALLWFSHNDGSRINLSVFSFIEILELRQRLQFELDWCDLTLVQPDKDTIEIGLYRAFDITMNDIELARNKDLDSSFLRNLIRLKDEWVSLSPIFSGIAHKQIASLAGLEMLMREPTGIG